MESEPLENEPHALVAQATARITAAFVRNNRLDSGDVPGVLARVGAALATGGQTVAAPAPSVNPRRLVSADAVICAECGRSGKTMSRHLRAEHDLTPDAYRAKWGLPHAHPLVAPSYSARRSQLAREIGLGSRPQSRTRKPKPKR